MRTFFEIMANPMINSGTELLQLSADEEYDLYEIVTKKISSRQSKCISLGIFTVIMFVLLAIGIYISFGMWDPTRAQRWRDTTCHVPHADCPADFDQPPVILVSMDGFRASYLQRERTPTLHRLSECGVSVPYMQASYPTKTFVNHYSIVTGLYPESHGIIDNWMLDPDTEQMFTISGTEALNPDWWKGEPIWNTVKRNGKVAATYFFPGSDVIIDGQRPNYWYPYNKSTPFEHRVQTVLRWLDLPKGERPDFITLYFDEPDTHGHMTGPDSEAVNNQLERVDDMIGMLMDGLKQRQLHKCTNIILLADHGMSSTSCERVVRLDKFVNTSNMLVFDGPFGRVNTGYRLNDNSMVVRTQNPENEEDVVKKLTCKSPHLVPTMKQNLPKRFHYANNRRIDNIILNVETRWLVARTEPSCPDGSHGYDVINRAEKAVFMAYGPSFKSSYKAPPFLNIEVYNLLTDLLGIPAAPNNGTAGALHHLLRAPSHTAPRADGHQYTTCTYPSNDDVYHQRANKSDCICRVPNGTTIEDVDQRLNMTSEQSDVIIKRLIPFGLPVQREPDNACILTQRNYISAYSHVYQSALWTAYVMDTPPPLEHDTHCLRPDVRLSSNTPNCATYNKLKSGLLQHEHLYPAWMEGDLSERMDAVVLSNVVPMYEGFKNGIWHHLMETLRTWSTTWSTGRLHVVVGPAFDYNYDGLKDYKDQIRTFVPDTTLPVASHFYAVVTRCKQYGLTCCNQYQSLAIILPHLSSLPPCTNLTQYLLDHSARVRDVELLTGLEFYAKLPLNVTLNLVTSVVDQLW